MAVSTTSSMNGLFNSIYEDALFVAREMNIMTGLVRNYSAQGWMNRVIGIYPALTAESVGEGVDYSNATEFTKTAHATLTPGAVIAQMILTDRRMDTDPDNARMDAAQELGNAIATKIDTDLASTFASFGTDKGDGAGNSATIANVAAAISVLRNSKAPQPIYVVMHPYHWHDCWIELGQPGANQALLGDVANQALRDFFVGRWVSAQWFTNANIAVDASDDAVSGVYNPQALGFDVRKAPTLEPERDASLMGWELNMSAGYAYGVIRDSFGVGFTADATEPT